MLIFGLIYNIVVLIQSFLAFGTAYRFTKSNGDNGASLFGWLFVFQLAAIVPFLGIYLWKKFRELGYDQPYN